MSVKVDSLETLYANASDRLDGFCNSTIDLIKRLQRKSEELKWDIDRLNNEIALKNQEIDRYKSESPKTANGSCYK